MFMDMAIEHLSIIDKLYTKLHDDYDEHCYDKLVEDTIGKFNGRIKGLDTDMDVITTLNEVYDNMEATNEKL
jgi:hypothetical protein